MKSFITRLISAVVAVLCIIGLIRFLGADGLRLLTVVAVVLGARELVSILFKPDDSRTIKTTFYLGCLGLYAGATLAPEFTAVLFSVISIVFCLISLAAQKKFDELHELAFAQAKSILGFFYIGLLPAIAAQILSRTNGVEWFLTLLFIVFAGDIAAYLFGMWIGKHKIMPKISPKKSVEGSIAGLIASTITAALCAHFLLNAPVVEMLGVGMVAGVVGQFGDFFESLLKRVADVKDSGNIMPGHGGILDRIDGVLFASPVILIAAMLIH